MQLHSTVKPQFYEVPRDWKNLFVNYIEGLLYRKPWFNEFLGKQPKCLLCGSVVIINFYCSAFLDLNNYWLIHICSFLSTELYKSTALKTQEQANKTAWNCCTHKFYPRWSVLHSTFRHVLTYCCVFIIIHYQTCSGTLKF